MKLKRILCVLLAAVTVSCSFAACGNNNDDGGDNNSTGTAAASEDVAAVADKLKSDIQYDDELIEIDDTKIAKILGVDQAAYTNAKVYISSSGATPEEIACFEATSSSTATTIEASLRARITAQTNTFTDYKPEQAPKLQNAVLKVKGNCVYFVVSGDSAKAETIIG